MSEYRNVQVIDGARNCAYDIFLMSERDFKQMFPAEGQDIEFIDDFVARTTEEEAARITEAMWASRVDKKRVQGIHGTLFYGLDFKKAYYPTKREAEMVTGVRYSK
jgi:hypothetical protein